MGEGKADDLIRIRGVCQDFLITCHSCIKTHLANGVTDRSAALSIKNLAIGQNKGARGCLIKGLHFGFDAHKSPFCPFQAQAQLLCGVLVRAGQDSRFNIHMLGKWMN